MDDFAIFGYWVWGAGGNFINPDGNNIEFDSPEALQGFKKYFDLIQFLASEARNKDDYQSDNLFSFGKAATIVSGPWLYGDSNLDQVIENTGFTALPGVPYIGGSHLAIWRHTPIKAAALDLVQHLTRLEVQTKYCQAIGMLPTKIEAFSSPYFAKNDSYQKLFKRLQIGHYFPSVPMWGTVENRLSASLGVIWDQLLSDPKQSIDETVEKNILSLATNLKIGLTQRF